MSSTDLAEQRALLTLSLVPGVGSGRLRALVAHFGSARRAAGASSEALSDVNGIGPQTAQAICAFDAEAALHAQLERARAVRARLVPYWSERFPTLLRQIYDPPALLWTRGELVPDDARAIAIVGTRRATAYGKRVAYDMAGALATQGYTVVSGMAYGIDTAAHRGALDAGGRTIAVFGCGVDTIYPSRNRALAEHIIQQGALVSEYAMGTKPEAAHFPRRNRIVSGLSLGTLVVEAFSSGGALITAYMALEQNREVFAIPGPVHSPASEGCNRLIQKGYAKLVNSVDDVLEEVADQVLTPPAAAPPPTGEGPPPEDLNTVEQKLYDALSTDPIHLDVLCERTSLDTSTALVYLLSLEFKGLVRQMAGKQFFRA